MHKRSKDTVHAIANANALATGIVHQISGNEVAKTLNGQQTTRSVLANLIGSRIHANFSKHISKAVK